MIHRWKTNAGKKYSIFEPIAKLGFIESKAEIMLLGLYHFHDLSYYSHIPRYCVVCMNSSTTI